MFIVITGIALALNVALVGFAVLRGDREPVADAEPLAAPTRVVDEARAG